MRALARWSVHGPCSTCTKPSINCRYRHGYVIIKDGAIHDAECTRPYEHNLPVHLATRSFDNFELVHEGHKEIVQACKQLTTGKHNVLFLGKNGSGKGHLSTALFKAIKLKKYYMNFVNLHNELKKYFKANSGTGPIEAKLKKAPLLYIDDIGKGLVQGTSTWYREFWYSVFEYRINHNIGCWISTTTLNMQELKERLSSDVIDRMYHNTVIIRMPGDSYRKYKQQQLQEEVFS